MSVVALAGWAERPEPAVASTSCAPTDGNYFSGATNNPQTFEPWGARAQVFRPKAPSLCGAGPNSAEASTVWVMLAGDGNEHQYAQIGYVWKNYGSGANRFFWEWSEGAGDDEYSQVFWGEATAGTSYDMRASYYPSDGRIHLILNGAQPACVDGQCAQTAFDPFNEWPGTNAQWYAETLNTGSDIFGTADDQGYFSSIQTKNENDDWGGQNLAMYSSECYYHYYEDSSSMFNFWTDPLDHSC